MAPDYRRDDFVARAGVLAASECADILARVEARRDALIPVEIDSLIAKNKFFTINGEELEELVPRVKELSAELLAIASALEGHALAPLENKNVGLSLNITPPGGQLSWHYDRNLVTAVIHLNEVCGGAFEVYPGYRVRLRDNHRGPRRVLQRVLDAALRPEPVRERLGRRVMVSPTVGGVVFMGSTCLHQVAPVTGERSRGAIVFCYDTPGKVFDRANTKNYYGYRDRKASVYG
jgi:hypothetical protein